MDLTQPLLDSSISLFRDYLNWMNKGDNNVKTDIPFDPSIIVV